MPPKGAHFTIAHSTFQAFLCLSFVCQHWWLSDPSTKCLITQCHSKPSILGLLGLFCTAVERLRQQTEQSSASWGQHEKCPKAHSWEQEGDVPSQQSSTEHLASCHSGWYRVLQACTQLAGICSLVAVRILHLFFILKNIYSSYIAKN